ncbi:MAG: prepilin peptidase [Candidatus Diapherotrites archaeon]|nr:prepilin peptidase [Candidatus Diapherotrites archaeon]
MYFSIAYFLLSVFGLGYATYTDFRERIVANRLTFGLIAIGIALHFADALANAQMLVFYETVFAVIATFVFAYALYHFGVWAGGDVKLFTAIAALNPINYAFLGSALGISAPLLETIALPLFPLTLFVFSVLAMLPYGLALSINGIRKNAELRKIIMPEIKGRLLHIAEFAIAVGALNAIFIQLKWNAYLVLIALIVMALLPKLIRMALDAVLIAIALFFDAYALAFDFLVLFAVVAAIYLLLKLYVVGRDEAMRKRMKITALEEGMIVAENIVSRNGKIIRVKPLGFGELWDYFRGMNMRALSERMRIKGKIIASARRAGGVSEEEIAELKKLVRQKKLKDEICIKMSVPFVPAILIAFIVLSIVGDILWNLVLL